MDPQNRIFNAYVDGYNLYYGILKRYPEFKWLDLINWLSLQMPGYLLNTVYYFSAPVKEAYPFDDSPRRQHTYWRVLRDSGVQIVEGHFRKDLKSYPFQGKQLEKFSNPALPNVFGSGQRKVSKLFQETFPEYPDAKVTKMEEKGSDVNLALYLLRDVYSLSIQGALVVTTDSDLAVPVSMAVDTGVFTKIIAPGQVNSIDKLRNSASEVERLKPDLIGAFQFPDIYITKKNSSIFKPKNWN
jgi:hypothetical protein